MSKQILPNELAEILNVLLIAPTSIGELDTQAAYEGFILDLGEVVAAYCGGRINGVNPADCVDPDCDYESRMPLLSVSPDESLPSFHRNVWSYFDAAGWDGEETDGDDSVPMTGHEVIKARASFQACLFNLALSQGKNPEIAFPMVSHQDAFKPAGAENGEERPFEVRISLGNQITLDWVNSEREPVAGMLIEIDHGVPAFHIDLQGGDVCLHSHLMKDGIVLTPACDNKVFEQAEVSIYTYDQTDSLFLRDSTQS